MRNLNIYIMLNMKHREKLKFFLEWLITPQDENESKLFNENNCVDDYIKIKSKIDNMSEQELVEEINNQLSVYGLSVSN